MNDMFDCLKTLETVWKGILKRDLFGLATHIDPDNGLIDLLVSSEVLDKRSAAITRAKGKKYDRSVAILGFIDRRPFKDFIKFCEALCKTLQEQIVQSFFCPLGIEAMMKPTPVDTDPVDVVPVTFDWRNRIRKHLTCLSEVIDPDNGLISALAMNKVILEHIMDKYEVRKGFCARVQLILFDLILKSDKDFLLFCKSLEESGQPHIVTCYLSPKSVECYRHSLQRPLTCSAVDATDRHIAPNWRYLLRKNFSCLTEEILSTVDLITYLENSEVMNKLCAEKCKELEPEFKQTDYILNHLRTRPDKDFAVFCKALESFGQKHVVEMYLQEENVSPGLHESNSAPVTSSSHLGLGDRHECTSQKEICQGENPQTENHKALQQVEDNNHNVNCELSGAIHCTSQEETVQIVENVDPPSIQGVQNVDPHFTEHTESHLPDSGFACRMCTESSNVPSDLNGTEGSNMQIAIEDSFFQDRPTPIQEVIVLHSTARFYEQNLHGSYVMSKAVRGRCIIFNNHKFIRMRERTGAIVDGELLRKLFQMLSFSVDEIRDASAETIKSKLYDISRDETLGNDQCLVVFVLSHGDYRNGKCLIYGSDDSFFTLDDVLNPFAQNNCWQMRGKPKLVFIQACRGEQYDFTHSDASPEGENEEQPVIPSYPDFLIGFPTQAGYRAFRDIEYGSWYINALARVFMAKAHDTPLSSMMNEVAGIASKWLSQTGSCETNDKTQYATYTCSFTKDLFFFPGIVE